MDWSFTPADPGSITPGDFRLQHDGTRLSAWSIFRAIGSFPEVQSILRAEMKSAVDSAVAKSIAKVRLDDLRRRKDEMTAKVADIDARLAALAARRIDPAILDTKDLSAELLRIATEEAVLQQQRQATAESLSVFDPHIKREQTAFDAETLAAGQQALKQRRQAALDRRRELLDELAAAVSPVLTELIQAETECGALLSDDTIKGIGLPCAGDGKIWTPAGPQ